MTCDPIVLDGHASPPAEVVGLVLVVDGDGIAARNIRRILKKAGLSEVVQRSSLPARQLPRREAFDLRFGAPPRGRDRGRSSEETIHPSIRERSPGVRR